MNTNRNSKHRKVASCVLSLALATPAVLGIASSASAAPANSAGAGVITATTPKLKNATVVSPDGVAQVRSGPGVRYKSVMTLTNGSTVTVLETRNGWSRVGIDQWIATWLLQPSETTTTPTNTIWRVQVGASQTKSKAEQVATAARAKGFKTYVRHVGGWYRVQVGAFAVRENADKMLATAQKAGFKDAFIRTD